MQTDQSRQWRRSSFWSLPSQPCRRCPAARTPMPHHQPRPPHPRASPFRTPGAVVKTHNSSVGSVSGRWVGRNWGVPTALPTHDFQMFASSSVSTVVTAVGVRTVCRSGCVLFIKLFKSLRSWSRCSSCCFEVFKRSLSFRITVPCLLTSCWSSFFDTKGTAQFSLVAVAISSDLRAARPILIGTSALIHRLGSLSCAPPPFYRLVGWSGLAFTIKDAQIDTVAPRCV